MQDSELKKLLLETCPIRPGQESRAWTALRDRLQGANPADARLAWLYFPTWRGLGLALVVLALIPIMGDFMATSMKPISLATVDSQSPGIYATAFYSQTAQAQVVWLNGMDPATDKPTYLDPTTVVAGADASSPAGDPNSL